MINESDIIKKEITSLPTKEEMQKADTPWLLTHIKDENGEIKAVHIFSSLTKYINNLKSGSDLNDVIYEINEESLKALDQFPDLDSRGPKMCEYLESVKDSNDRDMFYGVNVDKASEKTIIVLLNIIYLDAKWGGDISEYYKSGYVLKLLERLKEIGEGK